RRSGAAAAGVGVDGDAVAQDHVGGGAGGLNGAGTDVVVGEDVAVEPGARRRAGPLDGQELQRVGQGADLAQDDGVGAVAVAGDDGQAQSPGRRGGDGRARQVHHPAGPVEVVVGVDGDVGAHHDAAGGPAEVDVAGAGALVGADPAVDGRLPGGG